MGKRYLKWMILPIIPALVFVGVAAYILHARGLNAFKDSLAGKPETEEKKQKEPAAEKTGLTASILNRDEELNEKAKRLEELAGRIELEREGLKAESAIVEEKIKALKKQEEQLKAESALAEEKMKALKQEEEQIKALRQKPKPIPASESKPSPASEPAIGPTRPSTPTEDMIKLAKMYESMPPENAASVLENLSDSTTAQLLLQMRRRQASQIMGLLSPDKAASISKILAGETTGAKGRSERKEQ